MQNIVILAGNIGQTPEVRTTQSGTKITNFSLATSRPRLSEGRVMRDENGYRVMDTEWHRITCFNGLGKTACTSTCASRIRASATPSRSPSASTASTRPPLGACPDCGIDDFENLIRFMVRMESE